MTRKYQVWLAIVPVVKRRHVAYGAGPGDRGERLRWRSTGRVAGCARTAPQVTVIRSLVADRPARCGVDRRRGWGRDEDGDGVRPGRLAAVFTAATRYAYVSPSETAVSVNVVPCRLRAGAVAIWANVAPAVDDARWIANPVSFVRVVSPGQLDLRAGLQRGREGRRCAESGPRPGGRDRLRGHGRELPAVADACSGPTTRY